MKALLGTACVVLLATSSIAAPTARQVENDEAIKQAEVAGPVIEEVGSAPVADVEPLAEADKQVTGLKKRYA